MRPLWWELHDILNHPHAYRACERNGELIIEPLPPEPPPGRFVEAGPFWRFALRRLGLAGIVMPITPRGPTCYYLRPWGRYLPFRQHEEVHFAQIARMGALRFTVAYLYYLARYGYRNNPFEKEAYGQETAETVETKAVAQDHQETRI